MTAKCEEIGLEGTEHEHREEGHADEERGDRGGASGFWDRRDE